MQKKFFFLIFKQSVSHISTVQLVQELQCNSLNLIKYQSSAYTKLNDYTVLFQAIQFSISHLFAFSLNV